MTGEEWTAERLQARKQELESGLESTQYLDKDGRKANVAGIAMIAAGAVVVAVGLVVRRMGPGIDMIGIVGLMGGGGLIAAGGRSVAKAKTLASQAEAAREAFGRELREITRCITTGEVDKLARGQLGAVWQCVACNSMDTGRSADSGRMCNACGYISSN